MPRLPVRGIRLAVVLAVVLGVGPALVGPTAQAATDEAIDVVIEDLGPMIPRAGDELTVRGVIANVGTEPVDTPRLRLRVSSGPLADRAAITPVLTAPVSPPTGSPDDVPLYGTTVAVPGPIAPGEQRTFTVQIGVDDLRRSRPGVYVLGVEALGSLPQRPMARLGVERTLLPLMDDTTAPIGLAWLWPLADQPARDAAGTFLDDRTPRSLAAGGRLRALLDLADGQRDLVTWVVDPELLQAAAEIADGYQVLEGGERIVGDQSAAGGRWLADLRAAAEGRAVHALPYGDIDAVAVRRAGLQTDVVRAVTQAEPVAQSALGRPVTAGLAWAPTGRFDKQTANLLATAGVTTVILRASAMPPDPGSPAAVSGVSDYGTVLGPIDAVLVDDGLAAVITTAPATTAERLAARQRFLAETALVAQVAPGPLTLVAAPSDIRWRPSTELLSSLLAATSAAPWLQPASLADVLAAPRAARDRQAYGDRSRAAELPASYLAQVARTQARVGELADILDEPGAIVAPFTAALLRSESAAWRGDLASARTLLTRINRELRAAVAQVQVLSSGTVTFSGDAGRIPVTIANDSDQPVTVGLALVGEPPARLVSAPIESIAIEPGRKVSVEVDARVLGGEPLTVRVQLLTRQGEPYGTPTRISLTSTAYARAAAWVMGLAFAGIAVFVVVGVVRRIRKVRSASMAR